MPGDSSPSSRLSAPLLRAQADPRALSPDFAKALSYDEVQKHNNAESLWCIVKGQAYDLTDFAPEHPGGMKILLRYAGKDATEA